MRLSSILVTLAISLSLSACGDDPNSSSNSSSSSNDNSNTNSGSNNTGSSTDSGPNRLADNPGRNFSIRIDQGNSTTIDLAKLPIPANATIKIVEQPKHGLISVPQNHQTTYILNEAYVGYDQFKYAIVTADGTEHEYSVAVTVIPPTIKKLEVSPWKGNAKAAYSIIHDDYCSGDSKTIYVQNAYNELKKRGLVGGFGVIVSHCDADEYADLHMMEDNGMEVINHSWSHLDLTLPETDLATEIDQAHSTLKSENLSASYFVFPYDRETDDILQRISDLDSNAYLGARGGDDRSINEKDLNPNDDLAPFRANLDCFDVHEDSVAVDGNPSCAKYAASTNNDPVKILNYYLDDAISNGGWALRELHGVGVDGSWGWVSQEEYTTHLDYVATKVATGEVWMDTPTNITRYWASRAYCGSPASTDAGEVDFDAPSNSTGCIKYATKLDVIATIEDTNAISASQGGKDIVVKSLGDNRFLFPVDPLGGKVTLLRK